MSEKRRGDGAQPIRRHDRDEMGPRNGSIRIRGVGCFSFCAFAFALLEIPRRSQLRDEQCLELYMCLLRRVNAQMSSYCCYTRFKVQMEFVSWYNGIFYSALSYRNTRLPQHVHLPSPLAFSSHSLHTTNQPTPTNQTNVDLPLCTTVPFLIAVPFILFLRPACQPPNKKHRPAPSQSQHKQG